MKLLSFIVTVYNQEEYIEECIKSLLVLSHIADIIIIDDGSYDNSFQIVKDIQNRNSGISAFQQKNSGVSIARNNALNLVKTSYVSFVDGDDCLDFSDRKTIDILGDILRQGWDLIQYPMLFNWKSQYEKLKSSSQEIYGSKEYLKSYIRGDLSYSCCNKIFRKKILENNSFPEDRRYEDVCFLLSLTDVVDKIKIIPNGMYLYRYNEKSFTLKKVTSERVLDFVFMADLWEKKVYQYMLSDYWRVRLNVYLLIEFSVFQKDISILHILPRFILSRKTCVTCFFSNMPFRNRCFLLLNILLGTVNTVLLFSFIYKIKKRL